MRPRSFAGFRRCLPALAAAGDDLIVEHIIEFRACREDLARLLECLAGVHCDLAEVDRRERDRGDRRIGEGRALERCARCPARVRSRAGDGCQP
jgi:chloramphenicol 3-O phosphotransferase